MTVLLECLDLDVSALQVPNMKVTMDFLAACWKTVTLLLRHPECTGKIYSVVRSFYCTYASVSS